jgi:hypothetical protein
MSLGRKVINGMNKKQKGHPGVTSFPLFHIACVVVLMSDTA